MATAELSTLGDRIVVKTVWSQKDQIKQIPGSRWDADEKVWTVPASWAACKQLRGVFGGDLVIGENLRLWGKEQKYVKEQLLEQRANLDLPWSSQDHWMTKLYGFQRAGVQFMQNAESCLLGDEMGTGKTIQALSTIRSLDESSAQGLPALIVCPNSMKAVWKREAETWLPQAVPYVVQGSAVKRRQILEAAAADENALVIINFEMVRGHSRTEGFGSINLAKCGLCEKGSTVKEASCEVHPRELNKMKFRITIVDEAHRMKDAKTKQTRAIWAASRTSPRRIAMTGTPIASNPDDLWSIMHFVAPAEYPTKSKFVERYCELSFNGFAYEVNGLNKANKDEFFDVFYPRFRRVIKKAVLPQLPPKVYSTRTVAMDPKQVKAYDQMSSGLVSRLEDGSLMVAKKDIAAQTRLLQFSSAYMHKTGTKTNPKTGEEDDVFEMRDPAPKLDAMMDVVDEMGDKPLVIAFYHKQLLNLAAARLEKAGIVHAKLSGDTPQWQRDIDVQKFQKGEIPVFLFTIQAGGVGITLNTADTILFVQRSWSMIENLQAVDRVHRIGSEKFQQVNVIDLVTAGTIEENQIATIQLKEQRAQEVLQDETVFA